MTKRKAVAALLVNPQAAMILGWKLLGAMAEERRYWKEERRREAAGPMRPTLGEIDWDGDV